MAFPAFLDTNVLYGATLCDTLLRVAEQGAFRPHWSKDVLAELSEVLVREAGLLRARADRRIAAMQKAFRWLRSMTKNPWSKRCPVT